MSDGRIIRTNTSDIEKWYNEVLNNISYVETQVKSLRKSISPDAIKRLKESVKALEQVYNEEVIEA